MANIQWFPGHMAKAKREAFENLKQVDIIIECVDARIPESSRNPLVEEIIGEKRHIILLNKMDLANPEETKCWIAYYQQRGSIAIPLQAKDGQGLETVKKTMREMMKPEFEKWAAKGIVKPRAIRLMVLGIPNVGKSTFINRMIKKNQAETANKPGVTRGQRWLKIGKEFELLDTPGILWPKFENEGIGKKLALTGAIKDNLLHMDDIALFALEEFSFLNPALLCRQYGLDETDLSELTKPELLMKITKKLGMKEDFDKASERIVYDIRSGKMGRYTLDQAPQSIEELKSK